MDRSKFSAGEKYGNLVLVSQDLINRRRWLCDCDCGKRVSRIAARVRSGHIKSCGCLNPQFTNEKKDLVGLRFGRLTVVSFVGGKGRLAEWNCVCDCSNEKVVSGSNLRGGCVKSCGCLKLETSRETIKRAHAANLIHGKSGTPEYLAWHGFVLRGTEGDSTGYFDRGIRVCGRWRDSFDEFLLDLGFRPTPDHSIDRIDNDKHYSCGKCDECILNGWVANCRWSTQKEQCRNRSNCRIFDFQGKARTIAEISEISGVPYYRIWRRVEAGWPIDLAVSAPVMAFSTRGPFFKKDAS